MICLFCSRAVPFGGSRVQVHAGGRVYGDVPGADGRLSQATGALVSAYHKKCWLADKRRKQLQAAKDADPSAQHRRDTDWREPVTADVEEFLEGDRDHRGA